MFDSLISNTHPIFWDRNITCKVENWWYIGSAFDLK